MHLYETLTEFDPSELICAEPDRVSGGTRLANYLSLCQPAGQIPSIFEGLLGGGWGSGAWWLVVAVPGVGGP